MMMMMSIEQRKVLGYRTVAIISFIGHFAAPDYCIPAN